jgi:hypothetical protein
LALQLKRPRSWRFARRGPSIPALACIFVPDTRLGCRGPMRRACISYSDDWTKGKTAFNDQGSLAMFAAIRRALSRVTTAPSRGTTRPPPYSQQSRRLSTNGFAFVPVTCRFLGRQSSDCRTSVEHEYFTTDARSDLKSIFPLQSRSSGLFVAGEPSGTGLPIAKVVSGLSDREQQWHQAGESIERRALGNGLCGTVKVP